jgi:two-component system OmpR family sensor kinase
MSFEQGTAPRKNTTDSSRLEQRLHLLERLLTLEGIDLTTAMQQAAQHLAEVLSADKTDVFLPDPNSEVLVAVGTSDTPMGRLQHQLGLDRLPRAGGGRVARVFETGESHLSSRVDQDPVELPGISQQLGVACALYAPLHVGHQPRGVVVVSSAHPETYAEDDLIFLTVVARWLELIGERAVHVELLAEQAADAGYRAAAEQLLKMLTPRQREIAALVARGYSNAEIAQELVLVTGTVANHLEQILMRLGFRNRAQVAAWAAELGLHRRHREHP